MKALLVGYGEVGKAIYALAHDRHTVAIADPAQGFPIDPCLGKQDILLIALPWSDDFINLVKDYQAKARPEATIIFTTTAVGTCFYCGASHFPVEGTHPDIARDIKNNPRNWLGGPTHEAVAFLSRCGLKFKLLPEASWTEFMKLRSLAYFGLCIEYARAMKASADSLKLPWDVVREYDMAYNAILEENCRVMFRRPVLDPPEGPIGGHCVLKGVEILNSQLPDALLQIILERNGK